MRAITSCCHGDQRYERYADRLERTLRDHGYHGAIKIWRDSWPPGSPEHKARHYAFKWYAAEHARAKMGATRILWLDAAVKVVGPLDAVWLHLEEYGVYVMAGHEPLGEWVSDQALGHFNVGRDAAMGLSLCAGVIVGVNLDHEKGAAFFEKWGELARTRLFMSAHSPQSPNSMRSLWIEDGTDYGDPVVAATDPRVKGHRSDEACFSLILNSIGSEPVNMGEWHKVMQSGYDNFP